VGHPVPKLCNPVFFFGRCFNINDGCEGRQLQAHGAFSHVTATGFIVTAARPQPSQQKWIKGITEKRKERKKQRKKERKKERKNE
jgi:hypothetical protein